MQTEPRGIEDFKNILDSAIGLDIHNFSIVDGKLDKENPITLEMLREEMDFFEHSQDPVEFAQMLEVIRGAKSLLEIGSRFGGTLRRMAEVLAPGSMVVSVDLTLVDGTPPMLDPQASLIENCGKIVKMGHRVQLGLGDSRSPEIIEVVRKFAPFDFCFIDADHAYESVKLDWENYGRMAKVVGFHDVGGGAEGCVKLWNEIKDQYRHEEFFHVNDKRRLGIGIIYREEPV